MPSTVYYFLSQVIRRYHERYPKVRIKVFDAGANEVLAAVARPAQRAEGRADEFAHPLHVLQQHLVREQVTDAHDRRHLVEPVRQDLLFLPVRRRQVFGATQDFRGALGALAHAALVAQVGKRKLPDARLDDEVGLGLDFALVDLAVPVQHDFGHGPLLLERLE